MRCVRNRLGVMKYVVWGGGQLGRKAVSIIGKGKIALWVDTNSELQGAEINGIKVESPDAIKTIEEKFIILITPAAYEEQIARELELEEYYNYFYFSDHPYCMDMSDEADSIRVLDYLPRFDGTILLYGINWFNLYLYDFFKIRGEKAIIYASGKEYDYFYELIKDDYEVTSDEIHIASANHIFAPIDIKGLPTEKTKVIDELIEEACPISHPEVSKYKNIYKGKRCFIVATGPSLKVDDLDKINANGDISISMNRIYNIFDRTLWRPDYYVIEDQKMIEDLAPTIAKLDLKTKFVSENPQSYWEQPEAETSIPYKMVMQDCLSSRIGFSLNPDRIMYNGYSVTYVCLQLAVYMGFSEIYLIGVDFNYSSDVYAESNHFEGYQGHYKDIRLNPIEPERMKRAYQKARVVSEAKGIHIFNATRGGKLEVFERVDLDKILDV